MVRTRMSAHMKEAPLTVSKEDVAKIAVAREGGQDRRLGPGPLPLRDADPQAHPASDIQAAADLIPAPFRTFRTFCTIRL